MERLSRDLERKATCRLHRKIQNNYDNLTIPKKFGGQRPSLWPLVRLLPETIFFHSMKTTYSLSFSELFICILDSYASSARAISKNKELAQKKCNISFRPGHLAPCGGHRAVLLQKTEEIHVRGTPP
jgi:hypothetical protein